MRILQAMGPLPRYNEPAVSSGVRVGGPKLTQGLILAQTAFIKQEALEKAREIKVKADEEFSIEKVSSLSSAMTT